MVDQLLPLRVILVSGSAADHETFQQAGSAAKLPVAVTTIFSCDRACRAAESADLVFLDAALDRGQRTQVEEAGRAAAKPPFTVLLAPPGTPLGLLTTDAVAAKPVRPEEASRLLERAARVRVPSRALLVDDSPTMRSIVRKTLAATRFPFEVTEAAEGLTAIKLVKEREFDVVFLDYNMPDFSGLETLAEFKREKRRSSVVVMTSLADEALADRVRAQGAAFLKKPFFPADVETALTRHYGLVALNPKRA